MCGRDAECIVTADGPTCKCPQGYLGNPFPGGNCVTDQCSSSQPCQDGQVCIGGRCKHRCENIVCGVGAKCNPSTGKCVCEANFIGNPALLCMPPVTKPVCVPACGENAHCKYGLLSTECECNPDTVGNPYEACGPQSKSSCADTYCGVAAECREGQHSISECFCPPGFTGNPFIQCHDIDECTNGGTCGYGAVCINTPGNYDCKCKPNTVGNPFVMCSPIGGTICHDPYSCKCGPDSLCPGGFTCEAGVCRDLCDNIKCGPRAACDAGKCVCPSGYVGDANNLQTGCQVLGQCNIDHDCMHSEICFQLGRDLRKCVDACSKFQCGPNALCISNSHRATCICADGHFGNPSDFELGCQRTQTPQLDEECQSSDDCKTGQTCAISPSGRNICAYACDSVACGPNEHCQLDEHRNAVCQCKDGFAWNPVSSRCEKPLIPDCTSDNDCPQVAACQPDVLGILRCTSICTEFQCPANSVCVASHHKGSCQCLPGYVGNPKDRNGCVSERTNQCSSSATCPESEKCVKNPEIGVFQCRPACENVKCGPQAVCVTNNHVAQCQCPPGPYAGDPYDTVDGCKTVPCVYNIDCPSSQMCNRLTHTCYGVCDEMSCGDNAICIAENHGAVCQCPPGYTGDPIPEFGCKPSASCDKCSETSICEIGPSGPICRCPPGLTGFPETSGCFPIGTCPNGNADCPATADCINGRCVDKCDSTCGPNMACKFENNRAICVCPYRFKFVSNDAKDGCIRDTSVCLRDSDCSGGVCFNGQCSVACRNENDCAQNEKCISNICLVKCTSHSQCPLDQACRDGTCTIGCRSNKECAANEVCYNNKCQNPCQTAGVCGPNALCDFKNHITLCRCPAGFEPNPTPEQGCVRVPSSCTATSQCPPGHMCIANQCNVPCTDNLSCAVGERCADSMCAKVCYTNNNCLPGEICNDQGTCTPGCSVDGDCPATQVCVNDKCKCGNGFIASPFGCMDIDECTQNPCHPTAKCENIPGSFRCACPGQTVGNPFAEPGCELAGQCKKNSDCGNSLACIQHKCTEPCALADCGQNALCQSIEHNAVCLCPAGHLGDPLDKTIGCFRVECLNNEDCNQDKQCQPEVNKCISKCCLLYDTYQLKYNFHYRSLRQQ